MLILKTKIEVEINKIKVEKGYFCFKYSVTINDNFIETDVYDNSHSWEDIKAFKKLLKNGYAISLVVQWIFEKQNTEINLIM